MAKYTRIYDSNGNPKTVLTGTLDKYKAKGYTTTKNSATTTKKTTIAKPKATTTATKTTTVKSKPTTTKVTTTKPKPTTTVKPTPTIPTPNNNVKWTPEMIEAEIKRKALAGIPLDNSTPEKQKIYDSYKKQPISNVQGKWTPEMIDEEIKRKALAGIPLTDPTPEKQAKYDDYKANSVKWTPEMIEAEIKRKALAGIPLSDSTPEKQAKYDSYIKQPVPEIDEKLSGKTNATVSSNPTSNSVSSFTPPTLPKVTYNDALMKANMVLQPLYNQSLRNINSQRGFNALKAGELATSTGGNHSGLAKDLQNKVNIGTSNQIADLNATQMSEGAKMALQILNDDRNFNRLTENDAFNKWLSTENLNLNKLNSDRQFDISLANLLGNYQGQDTFDKDKFDFSKAIQEAGLTGNYYGQTTLPAQNANMEYLMKLLETTPYYQENLGDLVSHFPAYSNLNDMLNNLGGQATPWYKSFNLQEKGYELDRNYKSYLQNMGLTEQQGIQATNGFISQVLAENDLSSALDYIIENGQDIAKDGINIDKVLNAIYQRFQYEIDRPENKDKLSEVDKKLQNIFNSEGLQ